MTVRTSTPPPAAWWSDSATTHAVQPIPNVRNALCPICGSAKVKFILTGFDLNYLTSRDRHSIHACAGCGVAFSVPELDRVELSETYPPDYHVWRDSLSWLGVRKKGLLRETAQLSGSLRYAELFYPEVINPARFGRPGRVLEVGCGAGSGLASLRSAGWETLGIEPNPVAANLARARGIRILQSSLEESVLGEEKFDAIVMHHVLEHLVSAGKGLDKLEASLAPGGRIYVGVPNFASNARIFFGPSWALLDLPRHRLHFSPASLKRMFEERGLTTLDECYIVNMESILQSLINLYLQKKISANKSLRHSRRILKFRSTFSHVVGPFLSVVFGRILNGPGGTTFGLVVQKQRDGQASH